MFRSIFQFTGSGVAELHFVARMLATPARFAFIDSEKLFMNKIYICRKKCLLFRYSLYLDRFANLTITFESASAAFNWPEKRSQKLSPESSTLNTDTQIVNANI